MSKDSPDPSQYPSIATTQRMMAVALDEARRAAARGEVPIGAVLADAAGTILAQAGNCVEGGEGGTPDPAGHAEIIVLREAARQSGRPRLPDTVLYVTLEPCAMCAAAISFARVSRVVFAAEDPKGGAVVNGPRFFQQPTCHHQPLVERADDGGEAAQLLRAFFRARRKGGVRAAETWRDRAAEI